jgi:hypothetical protein
MQDTTTIISTVSQQTGMISAEKYVTLHQFSRSFFSAKIGFLSDGYVLFASAILGRANPQFVSQYGPFVDALFYDVAHNGVANDEIFFPLARHKSWFDGVSLVSSL